MKQLTFSQLWRALSLHCNWATKDLHLRDGDGLLWKLDGAGWIARDSSKGSHTKNIGQSLFVWDDDENAVFLLSTEGEPEERFDVLVAYDVDLSAALKYYV